MRVAPAEPFPFLGISPSPTVKGLGGKSEKWEKWDDLNCAIFAWPEDVQESVK
jgi:hypothetical protein